MWLQHTLSIIIPAEELALTGWDGRRVVLPGRYHLAFEGSNAKVQAELAITQRIEVEPPLPTPFASQTPGALRTDSLLSSWSTCMVFEFQ